LPSTNPPSLTHWPFASVFDHRAELLATAPDVYYLTDHYLNYPVVLVRLSRIHAESLRDLLGIAWRFVTAKKSSGKRTAII